MTGQHAGALPSGDASTRRVWKLGSGSPGLISYVIPAYNAGRYIEHTLFFCVAQDYRPLELLIVDDGSTDDTQEILRRFKARHESTGFRIIYIRQHNAGVNTARNRGVLQSTGAFIAFLDADDLLPPWRTSHLCDVLTRNGADLAYGPCRRFSCDGNLAEHLSEGSGGDNASVSEASFMPFAKWVPNVWSFIMTREFAEQVGPLSECIRTCCPDVDYTIRIRLCRPRMYRTSAIVNLYRATPGSMADRNRPAAVENALLSTRIIANDLRAMGVDEPESWRWVSSRFREIAWWAIRNRNKSGAIEACSQSARYAGARLVGASALLSILCRIPLAVPSLSYALRLRSKLLAYARRRAVAG